MQPIPVTWALKGALALALTCAALAPSALWACTPAPPYVTETYGQEDLVAGGALYLETYQAAARDMMLVDASGTIVSLNLEEGLGQGAYALPFDSDFFSRVRIPASLSAGTYTLESDDVFRGFSERVVVAAMPQPGVVSDDLQLTNARAYVRDRTYGGCDTSPEPVPTPWTYLEVTWDVPAGPSGGYAFLATVEGKLFLAEELSENRRQTVTGRYAWEGTRDGEVCVDVRVLDPSGSEAVPARTECFDLGALLDATPVPTATPDPTPHPGPGCESRAPSWVAAFLLIPLFRRRRR